MNERLTELAKQAKVEHCISHRRLDKFAESLIREVIYDCMNSVRGDDVTRIAMVAKNWGVGV